MTARIRGKLIYALKNSYSGVVGEMAVATALIRAGHRVSKPYWNDDEVDLLIFVRRDSTFIPIPVQVKSIQRLANEEDEFSVEGLRRKYVDRQPLLCLAIYCPESNKVWFIPGADRIKDVHKEGVTASKKRPGRTRTEYDALKPDSDVKIYVNLTDAGEPTFDERWLVDAKSPTKLNKAIFDLANRVTDSDMDRLMESFWAPQKEDTPTNSKDDEAAE